MRSTALGSWPKAIPPSFTLGHEILISSKSTGFRRVIYNTILSPRPQS